MEQNLTFTIHEETCPSVTLNSQRIPQAEDAKYLGLYLDRRLTGKNWKKHIFTKHKTTWTSTGENVLYIQ